MILQQYQTTTGVPFRQLGVFCVGENATCLALTTIQGEAKRLLIFVCCASVCYNLGCWTLCSRSGGRELNRVPSLDRFCGWVYGSCFFVQRRCTGFIISVPRLPLSPTRRRSAGSPSRFATRQLSSHPSRISRQVVALLERLRQEVSSLTSSTYEELVALSIDALETDFHAPGAAAGGTSDRSNDDDPATESATRESQQAPLRGGPCSTEISVNLRSVCQIRSTSLRKDLQSPSGSPGPQSSQRDAINHSSFVHPVVTVSRFLR